MELERELEREQERERELEREREQELEREQEREQELELEREQEQERERERELEQERELERERELELMENTFKKKTYPLNKAILRRDIDRVRDNFDRFVMAVASETFFQLLWRVLRNQLGAFRRPRAEGR